ncbi:ABC transporter substrate-binding protein, partial [bacterium]|nr:ABC transporter substrate-binding protein [bacterium]
MIIGRKCFFMVLTVALLALAGCAELEKSYVGDPASSRDLKPVAAQKADWQLQAEQLERLGDYSGACQTLRKRYIVYAEIEVADHFSLLLSYLSGDQLAELWSRESDKELKCRVGAEYFFRLKQTPVADLLAEERLLLLDLARVLNSGCEVGEDVRAAAETFLLAHQLQTDDVEIRVGCLLPLTGPNAAAGERFLRGMEIALEVYPRPELSENEVVSKEQSPPLVIVNTVPSIETITATEALNDIGLAEDVPLPRLRVFFYDTAGEGERARAGVRYLVNQKKVNLLIGPYTGKAANYAAVEAHSRGVTMVSLSPLLHNLERYPNVFQHYPTIPNQAVSLADLAMTRMGLKDFAMLVPKNRYGREFAEIFAAQAEAWGGQVVRKIYYDSSR